MFQKPYTPEKAGAQGARVARGAARANALRRSFAVRMVVPACDPVLPATRGLDAALAGLRADFHAKGP